MCRTLWMTFAVYCFSALWTPGKVTGNEEQILDICRLMSGHVTTMQGPLHSGLSEQSRALLSTMTNRLSDPSLQALLRDFIAASNNESQALEAFQHAETDLDEAQLKAILLNGLPFAIDIILDEDIDVRGLALGLAESTLEILEKQATALTKLNDWLEARIATTAAKFQCIKSLQTFLIDRIPSGKPYGIEELFSFSRPTANVDSDFSPHEFIGLAGINDNPPLNNVYAIVEYVCVAKLRDKNDPSAFQSKKLRDSASASQYGSVRQLLFIGEIGKQLERRLDLWQKYLAQPKMEIYHAGRMDEKSQVQSRLLSSPEMLLSVSAVRVLIATDEVLGLGVKEIKAEEQAILNLFTRWQSRDSRATAAQQASYKLQAERVRRAIANREKEAARFNAALSSANSSLLKWEREYRAKMR